MENNLQDEENSKGYRLRMSERLKIAYDIVTAKLEEAKIYLPSSSIKSTPSVLSLYEKLGPLLIEKDRIAKEPLSERLIEDNQAIDRCDEVLTMLLKELGLPVNGGLPEKMMIELGFLLETSHRIKTGISASVTFPDAVRGADGIEILAFFIPSSLEAIKLYRILGTRPSPEEFSRFWREQGFKFERMTQEDEIKDIHALVDPFTTIKDEETFKATPLVYPRGGIAIRIFLFQGFVA